MTASSEGRNLFGEFPPLGMALIRASVSLRHGDDDLTIWLRTHAGQTVALLATTEQGYRVRASDESIQEVTAGDLHQIALY
jgi:hypothetical protein